MGIKYDFTGVGGQSTLGGMTFLPEKYVWKINKMPEFFTWFLPEKLEKYPNFYNIFPKKITKFPNFKRFLHEKYQNFT